MYSSMASSIRGSTAHLSDRVHSKDELQALNTRLAKYIDKIRNLENENVALQVGERIYVTIQISIDYFDG